MIPTLEANIKFNIQPQNNEWPIHVIAESALHFYKQGELGWTTGFENASQNLFIYLCFDSLSGRFKILQENPLQVDSAGRIIGFYIWGTTKPKFSTNPEGNLVLDEDATLDGLVRMLAQFEESLEHKLQGES